jgi:16S rRNA (guanine966-N2)-methyltransferase
MSGLRVIGGKARGRRLFSVPGDTTRPITDRVKEALFNIIGADIENASFFDLFAGTGGVGIEALSRGAAFTLFVDLNRLPVETVRKNLKITDFESQAEVIRLDSLALLEQVPNRVFDYVYIAPPQYKGLWKQALLSLDTHPAWLSDDAWVIVQIHPVEYEDLEPSGSLQILMEFDQRDYGSTRLVFYERRLS